MNEQEWERLVSELRDQIDQLRRAGDGMADAIWRGLSLGRMRSRDEWIRVVAEVERREIFA